MPVLESLFDKVAALQSSNVAKFLKTPILKNIYERLLLLIVIYSRKNNHVQRCFDLPEPKFHKKLTV